MMETTSQTLDKMTIDAIVPNGSGGIVVYYGAADSVQYHAEWEQGDVDIDVTVWHDSKLIGRRLDKLNAEWAGSVLRTLGWYEKNGCWMHPRGAAGHNWRQALAFQADAMNEDSE